MDFALHLAACLACLLAGAAINRLRGGGNSMFQRLPGHSRFWAAGLMALFSCAALWDIRAGVAFGAAYLAWSLLPHGRWQTLGLLERDATGRPPTAFERVLERWIGRDFGLLMARHFIGIVPMAIALSYAGRPGAVLALSVYPVLIAGAYALGARLYRTGHTHNPVAVGETLTGALFGALLMPV